MKSLDDAKPQNNNVKWEDDILWHEIPQDNEWFQIRIVGGTFSFSNHWVSFTNDKGQDKKFPVGCCNWDQDAESASLDGGCLPCKLGIKGGVRYLLNVIDRRVQGNMKPGHNPIRALNLPPTALTALIALKKLNIQTDENGVKKPCSITDPDFGCDVWIQWNTQGKKDNWAFNKGDACPLTDEEREYELFDFDSIYKLPDPRQTEASLRRIGLLGDQEEVARPVPAKKVVTVPVDDEPAPAPKPVPVRTAAPAPKKVVAPKPAPVPDPVEEEAEEQAEEAVEEEVVPTPPPAPVKKVAPGAAKASPTVTAAKLGAPPPADKGKTEQPDCFAGYLGGVKCIRCSYKKTCSEATSSEE